MSREARHDQDIYRIANALETIADVLTNIRDQQGGSSPNPMMAR
jgi:hypothetical protein